jgi:hypothetical protein
MTIFYLICLSTNFSSIGSICLLRIIDKHVPIRDERKPTSNTSIKKTQQIDFSININFWISCWNFVKQPEGENQSLTVQFNFSLIQNWLKTEANKEETPSPNGVVWAYFLCCWASKSSCIHVFSGFGKNKKNRLGPASETWLPLWFFWLIISSRTIHSYITTSDNDSLSCFSKWE